MGIKKQTSKYCMSIVNETDASFRRTTVAILYL
jgi:hypothetical protein